MAEEYNRTRPQLEAVSADGEFLVFHRGGSVDISRFPRTVSVAAMPMSFGEEDPKLKPYRHADFLRELTGSDRPDREY